MTTYEQKKDGEVMPLIRKIKMSCETFAIATTEVRSSSAGLDVSSGESQWK